MNNEIECSNNCKKMQGRKPYFDTMKLMAITWVFVTHFVSKYHSEYFRLWSTPPTSYILKGISGKLAVAFFGVCLGYFAYNSRENDTTLYCLRRYIYFFICGLFINTVYAVLFKMDLYEIDIINNVAVYVITESLKIGSGIFATYWCMFPFFIASILSYISGKANVTPIGIIVEIIALWFAGLYWVAIAMLGAWAASLMENQKLIAFLDNRIVKIVLLLIAFLIVKRPESNITYLIDGICSVIVFIVVDNSATLQKILSIPLFAEIGKNVMAIYLIHVLVYKWVGGSLFALMTNVSYPVAFLLVMFICWVVMIGISFPVTKMLNDLMKVITKHLNRLIT